MTASRRDLPLASKTRMAAFSSFTSVAAGPLIASNAAEAVCHVRRLSDRYAHQLMQLPGVGPTTAEVEFSPVNTRSGTFEAGEPSNCQISTRCQRSSVQTAESGKPLTISNFPKSALHAQREMCALSKRQKSSTIRVPIKLVLVTQRRDIPLDRI